jgi:hypothetical protein
LQPDLISKVLVKIPLEIMLQAYSVDKLIIRLEIEQWLDIWEPFVHFCKLRMNFKDLRAVATHLVRKNTSKPASLTKAMMLCQVEIKCPNSVPIDQMLQVISIAMKEHTVE